MAIEGIQSLCYCLRFQKKCSGLPGTILNHTLYRLENMSYIYINAFGKTKIFFKITCPSDMKTVICICWQSYIFVDSYCVHNAVIVFQKFPALRKDELSLFSVIGTLKTFHFDELFLPGTLAEILISFLKTSIASSN